MKSSSTRGQSTMLFAFALVPVIGFAGLAIDVGNLYTVRRSAQGTADVAVAAAAQEASRPDARGSFRQIALDYAARNGFSTSNGDTIETNHPPLIGSHAGDPSAYEVIVRRPVPTALMRVLGSNATTVVAHSVAILKKSGVGILVLQPTGGDAFRVNGKSVLALTSGIVQVNSSDDNAFHVQDESKVTTTTRAGVVGNYKIDGKASVSPLPDPNAGVVPDPLASLPEPSCSLPVQYGDPAHPQELHITSDTTLCPGVYYGGINIDHQATVTFDDCGASPSEAVYVISDHGLKLHDSSRLIAKGVMIYNTGKLWCSAGYQPSACGEIHLDDKSTSDMTPPGSGTYEGILFFQNRTCNKHFELKGSVFSGMEGEIYMPAADVRIKGKGDKKKRVSGVIRASFIVKRMSIGNFTATDDIDPDDPNDTDADVSLDGLTGGSTRRVVLAE